MTPLTVFLLKESNPANPNLPGLVALMSAIQRRDVYQIADNMEWNQGSRFIVFCKDNATIINTPPRFTDRYHIIAHTVARKHPTQEPKDYVGTANRMIDIFTKGV
jgi:hypothetical protein